MDMVMGMEFLEKNRIKQKSGKVCYNSTKSDTLFLLYRNMQEQKK